MDARIKSGHDECVRVHTNLYFQTAGPKQHVIASVSEAIYTATNEKWIASSLHSSQ